jgi:hypothetical protein
MSKSITHDVEEKASGLCIVPRVFVKIKFYICTFFCNIEQKNLLTRGGRRKEAEGRREINF